MSGMLCGCEGAVVYMAVISNVVVISGMAALVGWALVLILGVFWLDQTRREQGASSARNNGRTGRAPQSHVARRSAPHQPTDELIPDLRVYAVLRAARKIHNLPDLPRPQIVAQLLAQADDTSRLSETWDCEPGPMPSHARVALPAPTFYAPRAMLLARPPAPINRRAARPVESPRSDIGAADIDADVLSFSARSLRSPHGAIARVVQGGGDVK